MTRKTHGALDYIVGAFLIVSPWLFGFADGGPAMYVPAFLGVGALLYSSLTNYEWGLIRVLPFSVHRMLDILSGAFLALSPWLFGFADFIYLPHLILGLFEITAALATRDVSEFTATTEAHAHRM